MSDTDQPRSFSYATFTETMLPEKQAVLDAVNEYEYCRRTPDRLPESERKLRARLREFEEQFPADFPFRHWHIRIMQGMVASTLGDFDAAIKLDQESLLAAGSDEQRAISYLNLSEDYRYAGRYNESVDFGLEAYRLNPAHKGLVCNLALALAKAGRRDDAKNILSVFLKDYSVDDPRDLFAAYVRYSEEMQELLDLRAE